MPFVVDLLPPAAGVEAAAALGLALGQRKSRGLFGRKQYEPLAVLARFGLPIKTVAWAPGENSGRCLVFDLQGLVSDTIQFALEPIIPQFELAPGIGEEVFLSLCQQWTKEATDFKPVSLNFTGLITQAEQAAPLLGGEDESLLVDLEQRAQPEETVEQLSQHLTAYGKAAQAWTEVRQRVYSCRDALVAKIREQMTEDKEASAIALADLTSQVETAIAAKRGETEAALTTTAADFNQRRDMLLGELDRFQENYREKADNYWRDQIKNAENALSEHDKTLAKRDQEIRTGFVEFERQQRTKIQEFNDALSKRQAAFESRLKRLDSTTDGFGKACDQRLAVYAQQPERVTAATLAISNERAQKNHNAVFYAARFSDGRWKVLPPQSLGSRGLKGAVSGLFGGLNLPFRSASKLGENLAGLLEKRLPGSELAQRLTEANLLGQEDFLLLAEAGLTDLIDQGKLDKKYTDIFKQVLVPEKESEEESCHEPCSCDAASLPPETRKSSYADSESQGKEGH